MAQLKPEPKEQERNSIKSALITKVTVARNSRAGAPLFALYHKSMPKRREKRVTMPLPVRLWGLDSEGKVFSQNLKTVNITPGGARLFGVTARLEPGFTVGLQRGNLKGRFVVVWVGENGTPREGQIGLRAVDSGIWGVPLPKPAEDYFAAWLDEEYFPGET